MWSALDGGCSIDELVDRVARRWRTQPATVAADVARATTTFDEAGLLARPHDERRGETGPDTPSIQVDEHHRDPDPSSPAVDRSAPVSRAIAAWAGRRLLIHAAAERNGRAVVIAGASGAGKSTLVALLAQRGMGYLTDELVAIDPDDWSIEPFAKAIDLDDRSLAMLGLAGAGRETVKSSVDPRSLGNVSTGARVSLLALLDARANDETTTVDPVDPLTGLVDVLDATFAETMRASTALDALAGLVQTVRTIRLPRLPLDRQAATVDAALRAT